MWRSSIALCVLAAVSGRGDSESMAVQVSAGGDHTCALDDTGVVTCWGALGSYQIRAP